ncbi:MAG: hypothetical protein CM1200mP26_01580 [Acidimicrobiales bacterium]|nr:MAG: hypothetical protein CM1200mP26_01580 [Acidimicrobiales bacterium]
MGTCMLWSAKTSGKAFEGSGLFPEVRLNRVLI